MAPEQIVGDLPLDARVDIYALGCLAYWLVTGEMVFRGTTALDTIVQHVRERPIPPSERTELDIPSSLEDVILRCLEKDPVNRPQSADHLSQLLRACEVNAPSSGRVVSKVVPTQSALVCNSRRRIVEISAHQRW
jgi:serine/threonine-protein kinase